MSKTKGKILIVHGIGTVPDRISYELTCRNNLLNGMKITRQNKPNFSRFQNDFKRRGR